MKKRKLMVCLLAGVLILVVSAGAAFGSVNGYAAYKNGVKALLLECDNVSLAGSMSVSLDGKEVVRSGETLVSAGADRSVYTWEGSEDQPSYTSRSVTVNGVNINYHSGMEPETYYSREVPQAENSSGMNFGGDNADELGRRLTTFLELAADTVMGDLKNNVVATGKEDGVSRYQVSISQNQVPALINAGLSLIAYSETSGSSRMVVYEDYHQSLAAYYESETGQGVSDELWKNYIDGYNDDWVDANQELVDAFDDIQKKYSTTRDAQVNQEDSGVFYIGKDNQVTRYDDKFAFCEAHPEEYENNWEALIGEDLSLESVDCSFGLDDQGRLVENDLTARFTTVDAKGQRHDLSFTLHLTAKDYGCAVVEPLDVTGWRDLSKEEDRGA